MALGVAMQEAYQQLQMARVQRPNHGRAR
jgi:hypothetical protein